MKMVTPYITQDRIDRTFPDKLSNENKNLTNHTLASRYSLLVEDESNLARCYIDLRKTVAAKQAQIDALMFEYCPGEMTNEQIFEWASHQRVVSPERTQEINKTLGKLK